MINDPRAVEPLIAALKDEDEYVRRHAAEALGETNDPRAAEPLIAALEDNYLNLHIRIKAAEALVRITGESFGENLVIWQKWFEQNKNRNFSAKRVQMPTWSTLTIIGFRDDTSRQEVAHFLLPYCKNTTMEQLLSALKRNRITVSKNLKKDTAERFKPKLEALGARVEVGDHNRNNKQVRLRQTGHDSAKHFSHGRGQVSKTYERLKKLEKKPENSLERRVSLQNFQMGQQEREVQDLWDEAEQLRQTIAILETSWTAFNRESDEANGELEELRSRFQELFQEVVARGKRLEELNQTHQSLVRELKREIEEKSLRNTELEKEIKNMRSEHQLKVRRLEEQVRQRDGEVQNFRDELGRLRQTVTALESAREAFKQKTSELKGQLQESRSRLELLSRQVNSRGERYDKIQSHHEEEVSSSTQEEVQKLWATYKRQLKTVKRTVTEESNSDSKSS